VSSPDGDELRILVAAADRRAIELLAPARPIAITAGDVRTLASVQMKGHVVRTEEGTADDRDRADRYCNAFFHDIEEMDGTHHALLERMRPGDVVPIVVRIDERFDQSPGPGAGTAIA
jgi:hypothetical protein